MEPAGEFLVFRPGRIAKRCRHQELLVACGTYRHVWQLQDHVLDRQG